MLKVSRIHICEMIECSFFLSVVGLVISHVVDKLFKMGVPSFFTSNRRAQKVAYKGFQYTKDRTTNRLLILA